MPDRVRRRLDEVFGDALPDVTSDEVTCDEVTRDDEGGSAAGRPGSAGDEWLRANRPPHHDDHG